MNNLVTISNGHLTKEMPRKAWEKVAPVNKKTGIRSWNKYVEVESKPLIQPGKPFETTFIPPVVKAMVSTDEVKEIKSAAPVGIDPVEPNPEPVKVEVEKTKGKPGRKPGKA